MSLLPSLLGVLTARLSRFYYWALNSSIIVRWALYIIPILAILWIPGIIGFTAAPEGNIWGTPLLWWSIWGESSLFHVEQD